MDLLLNSWVTCFVEQSGDCSEFHTAADWNAADNQKKKAVRDDFQAACDQVYHESHGISERPQISTLIKVSGFLHAV